MSTSSSPTAYEQLAAHFSGPKLVQIFPESAMKLIRLIDSDAPNRDLEAALASDPSLAAKILQASRSSVYGLDPSQIASLGMAINVLGHRSIRFLALSVFLTSTVSKRANCPQFNARRLGRHSLFVGFVATALAKERTLSKNEQQETFALAALHEISAALLAVIAPQVYSQTAMHAKRMQMSFDLAFAHLYRGSLHALGGMAVRAWGLPEVISESLFAMAKGGPTASNLVACLMLADMIAIREGFAHETWPVLKVADPVASGPFAFDATRLDAIVGAARREIEEFERAAA